VEIETLNARAEVEPLQAMAEQLTTLKDNGTEVLDTYLRNVRLQLYTQAQQVILSEK
jgi:hypothetical protein